MRKGLQKNRLWAGLNRPDAAAPDITIVGIPYDGAVCYRAGAAKGPDRIRSISAEIPPVVETGEILKELVVRDDGNLRFGKDFVASFPMIEKEIAARAAFSFVLTLGGDHSVAIPVHRALSMSASEEIGLIFVDAHTDLSDSFDGSPYSHACPLRRTMEEGKFSPENTVLVGTRCFEVAGLRFIQENEIKMFPAYEIADRGALAVADEIVKRLSHLQNIYLSIDIDALDPAFAPGTGIPDAGGLSTRDVMTLIRRLHPLPLVGADLVEVAPPLDVSDITSFAALRIITEIFGLVHRRKLQGQRFRLL
ncbi:MAG TPA: agmatinase [Candidatus Manganitrophaceae bacterium]|nr:agmatinase [Candidatus Manganitrophaceae bacterium]